MLSGARFDLQKTFHPLLIPLACRIELHFGEALAGGGVAQPSLIPTAAFSSGDPIQYEYFAATAKSDCMSSGDGGVVAPCWAGFAISRKNS